MRHHLERLRRAVWSYKQPLTHVPTVVGAPVSDLFIWRNSPEWETFFELTDMPALFASEENARRNVTLMFFDAAGQLFLEKTIETAPHRRNTLVLSEVIGTAHGETGTFSVFHSHTPQNLSDLGAHLAERGYVSYRYRGAPLRAYVHGNLDAIARLSDHSLQLLGGCSVRRREYHLQHALSGPNNYELAIVNPTSKKQRIICRILSADGTLYSSQAADLAPRGSHLFKAAPEHAQQRIVMSSRLVMARPVVFRIQNQTMDVFHG